MAKPVGRVEGPNFIHPKIQESASVIPEVAMKIKGLISLQKVRVFSVKVSLTA
jgi:hypothetical protein